jgi:antitoxin MazE
MQTKVQKWGNSLALRIPKTYALEMGLENDSSVELKYEDGKLIIEVSETDELLEEDEFTLEELVAQITDENMHDYIETGPAVGNEFW